jgi:hypothetical protein
MNAAAAKAQKQEEAAVSAATTPSTPGVRSKPGDALTFQIGDKSEVTLYGHVDVSADYQTSGLKNAVGAACSIVVAWRLQPFDHLDNGRASRQQTPPGHTIGPGSDAYRAGGPLEPVPKR